MNGRDPEARKQIDIALSVGLRNARIFRHAGEIARSMGDEATARKFLRESADLNSLESDKAEATLVQFSERAQHQVAR